MAIRTVFGGEQLFAPCGVAWVLKKTDRVEIDEEVGGGLFVDVGWTNALLAHGGPHHRRMIPDNGGQLNRCIAAVEARTQIRTCLATLALNTVALYAGFSLEDLLPSPRISRFGGENATVLKSNCD